jgi:hypothetical protein
MKKQNVIRKVIGREYLPTNYPWYAVFALYLLADKVNQSFYWWFFFIATALLTLWWFISVFTEQECDVNGLDNEDNYLNLP